MTKLDGSLSTRFIGKRIARKEDARFLTGHGQYVDDVRIPGTYEVAFARSDVARGTIDLGRRRRRGSDARCRGRVRRGRPQPPRRRLRASTTSRCWATAASFRVLADGDVRFVGEPVAMVVAESRYLAEDAVDAIEIDIERADAAGRLRARARRRRAGRAPRDRLEPAGRHPGAWRTRRARGRSMASRAGRDLTETFSQHRYATVPMETRGILASWDPSDAGADRLDRRRRDRTVCAATVARVLGIDAVAGAGDHARRRWRVRAQDEPEPGGGRRRPRHPLLGRPVKWIQDRRENLMCDQHAREDQATVTMAADEDGTLLARQGRVPRERRRVPDGRWQRRRALRDGLPRALPACRCSRRSGTRCTRTRRGVAAYRGPWMIETVVREQMIDSLAAQLGIDPLELRRRNVLRDEELPLHDAERDGLSTR